MRKRWVLPALLLGLLLLAACGAGGEELPPEPEEGVLVYAALNPVSRSLERSVNAFNKAHADARIEIRDYSDETGTERLFVELSAGRVPDIMELHRYGGGADEKISSFWPLAGVSELPEDEYWMPYRQLAQKGYLENLWPYIERDPELGRESVLEAPLKAAEVDGGLYMLFKKFVIFTLMGSESVVGDRYGWTFDELMEVFSAMPDNSTILRYNFTKRDVFFDFLCYALDGFVDWNTGRCSFDSESFRNLLEFLNCFPDEVPEEPPEQTEDEIMWRIVHGEQMLESSMLMMVTEINYFDTLLKGRASFPGYPTADGSSGSFFYPNGRVLAMSSACRNKEAAWDFIRNLITQKYSLRVMIDALMKDSSIAAESYIPVNREDFNSSVLSELELSNQVDLKKDPHGLPPMSLFPDDRYPIYPEDTPSEEDALRYNRLINSITKIYWPNDELSNIVWDACGPYFAGDRTLDETIKMIDNRVRLYVSETR